MSSPEGFGAEVRRRRRGLGLSAEQLAARAGLSEGCVLQIERGDRKTGPTLAVMTAIARELGVHLAELLGASERSPRASEGARILDGLDEPTAEAALGVLQALDAARRGPGSGER